MLVKKKKIELGRAFLKKRTYSKIEQFRIRSKGKIREH